MKTHETTNQALLMRGASPPTASSTLRASFDELPRIVQKMMQIRGVTVPPDLRTNAAFLRFCEQNLDSTTLQAVAGRQDDPRRALPLVEGHLNSRSAEALALHLYIKELLRLMRVAAAHQPLGAHRKR